MWGVEGEGGVERTWRQGRVDYCHVLLSGDLLYYMYYDAKFYTFRRKCFNNRIIHDKYDVTVNPQGLKHGNIIPEIIA